MDIPPHAPPRGAENGSRHSLEQQARAQLARWFAGRGISVESLLVPDDRALLLGDVTAGATVHRACRSLLTQLAVRMKQRSSRPVRIRREGLSEEEADQVRVLARSLARHGIVARTFRSDQAAVAVAPLTFHRTNATAFGRITCLLDGTWLEYFALGVARQVLGSSVPVAHRPVLCLPNGSRVELDVFALVGGCPVWVECKSGRHFHGELAKYGTLADLLGIGSARSIVAVSGGLDAGHARSLGLIHGLTVTAAADLASVLATAATSRGG